MERVMLQVLAHSTSKGCGDRECDKQGTCSHPADVFLYRDTVTRRRGTAGADSDPTRGKSYGKRNGNPMSRVSACGRTGSRLARPVTTGSRRVYRKPVGRDG